MKYAQIRKFDVANGPGIRVSIFVSGCTHNCYNCFNKEYQSFNYGDDWTKDTTKKIIDYLDKKQVSGLSILGGEPFDNARDLTTILRNIKKYSSKNIWVWTGYIIEDILKDPFKLELLKEIDVLVDGPYIDRKKDLTLKFRGSSNQRIIDVKETLYKEELVGYY